jgi:hypothetical protein
MERQYLEKGSPQGSQGKLSAENFKPSSRKVNHQPCPPYFVQALEDEIQQAIISPVRTQLAVEHPPQDESAFTIQEQKGWCYH